MLSKRCTVCFAAAIRDQSQNVLLQPFGTRSQNREMDLRTLLAKASPARSGDELAGVGAQTAAERVGAQMKLAEVPLKRFLHHE